jgi:hypothetical protein
MVTIMSETVKPEDGFSVYMLKDKMGRSGYTPMAAGLAVESLIRKEMIERFELIDHDAQESYTACRLMSKGIDWLLQNQDRFRMRKDEQGEELVAKTTIPVTDEDIPF